MDALKARQLFRVKVLDLQTIPHAFVCALGHALMNVEQCKDLCRVAGRRNVVEVVAVRPRSALQTITKQQMRMTILKLHRALGSDTYHCDGLHAQVDLDEQRRRPRRGCGERIDGRVGHNVIGKNMFVSDLGRVVVVAVVTGAAQREKLQFSSEILRLLSLKYVCGSDVSRR